MVKMVSTFLLWELGAHQAPTLPNSKVFKANSMLIYLFFFLYRVQFHRSINVNKIKKNVSTFPLWELGAYQAPTLPNSNVLKTNPILIYAFFFLYRDEIRYSIDVDGKNGKYFSSVGARSSPGADAPKIEHISCDLY